MALAPVAWVIATARDPRRFAAGLILACVVFFIVWYPNIAALPLPSAIVNAYQGLLPTYLYAFQFPVNTDPVVQGLKLIDGPPLVLFGALLGTVVIVGYSAWTWRIAIAEREAERRDPGRSPPARRASPARRRDRPPRGLRSARADRPDRTARPRSAHRPRAAAAGADLGGRHGCL